MLISIIIPTFNCKPFLKRCIDSVKAQTYSEWECIIVDDCSTDGSQELIKSLVEGDSRFMVQLWGIHRNAGCSRNQGILASHGDALFFLDADDWIEPKMLEYLVSIHNNYPQVGRIFSPPIVHREADNYTHIWGFSHGGLHEPFSEWLFKDASCDPGHCTGCLYVLSNIQGKVRFNEDVRVLEDMVFNMGLIFSGISTYITYDSYYNYTRRKSGSLVSSYPFTIRHAEIANDALEELHEMYHPPKEVFTRCRDMLNIRIMGLLAKQQERNKQ